MVKDVDELLEKLQKEAKILWKLYLIDLTLQFQLETSYKSLRILGVIIQFQIL